MKNEFNLSDNEIWMELRTDEEGDYVGGVAMIAVPRVGDDLNLNPDEGEYRSVSGTVTSVVWTSSRNVHVSFRPVFLETRQEHRKRHAHSFVGG